MKKKGFTLIELLAVIVILSIILLIAVPVVSGIIENSRRSTFKSSVKTLIKQVEVELLSNELAQETSFGTISELNIDDANNWRGEWTYDATNETITLTNVSDTKYEIKTVTNDNKFEDYIVDKLEIPIVAPWVACGDVLTDIRDSKIYNTIQIGSQCWITDNLAYTNSDCEEATWDQTAPHDACRTNGGTDWEKDEVLYQWDAAMKVTTIEGTQGMCPIGWHIPTDNEWKTLEMTLGMTDAETNLTGYRGTNQGEILKSLSPTWGGNEALAIGFNGKPVGYRSETDGTLYSFDTYGYWWTSSKSVTTSWRRYLKFSETRVNRTSISPSYGHSIRCVLD